MLIRLYPDMDFENASCVKLTARGLKNFWLSDSLKDQLSARTICRGCPVQMDCAEYALSIHATHGVWGGIVFGAFEDPSARKVTRARS